MMRLPMPTCGPAMPTPSCCGARTVASILAINVLISLDLSSAFVKSTHGVRRIALSSGHTVTYITESDWRMIRRSSFVNAFGRLKARNTAIRINSGKRYRLICFIVTFIGTGI